MIGKVIDIPESRLSLIGKVSVFFNFRLTLIGEVSDIFIFTSGRRVFLSLLSVIFPKPDYHGFWTVRYVLRGGNEGCAGKFIEYAKLDIGLLKKTGTQLLG